MVALTVVAGVGFPAAASAAGRTHGAAGAMARTSAAAPSQVPLPGPSQAPQWWFDEWHVPALWATGADGRGITIAVIDTGVQAGLPEFAGRVTAGLDLTGSHLPGLGGNGRTDLDAGAFSHGTAMASLMVAGRGPYGITGVAPSAHVMPISIPLAGEVSHPGTLPGTTALAVRYAAEHGAKVISMSFGGSAGTSAGFSCPAPLQDAVDYARSRGALLVAAVGNDPVGNGPVGRGSVESASSAASEPGACSGVLSIGAVTSQRLVANFSARQPYLNLVAPGENVATLSRRVGQAFVGSGTSQAAALASGAIAMVWSKYPKESGTEIASRIVATARDLGPRGRDDAYGYGLIEPAAAIAEPAAAGAHSGKLALTVVGVGSVGCAVTLVLWWLRRRGG